MVESTFWKLPSQRKKLNLQKTISKLQGKSRCFWEYASYSGSEKHGNDKNTCLVLISRGGSLLKSVTDEARISRWNDFVTRVFEELLSLRDVKNVSVPLDSNAFTNAGIPTSKVDKLASKFSSLCRWSLVCWLHQIPLWSSAVLGWFEWECSYKCRILFEFDALKTKRWQLNSLASAGEALCAGYTQSHCEAVQSWVD